MLGWSAQQLKAVSHFGSGILIIATRSGMAPEGRRSQYLNSLKSVQDFATSVRGLSWVALPVLFLLFPFVITVDPSLPSIDLALGDNDGARQRRPCL